MPGYAYVVLGAGKQGVAAAYDLILHGRARRLTLADSSSAFVQPALRRLRRLLAPVLKKNHVELRGVGIDARKKSRLVRLLRGHDAALSCLPYYLNPAVADAAIAARVSYCDLGGYFDTTRQILKRHRRARKAGVTLIPDCGVAPGLCNSLAVCGMGRLDKVQDVRIYCGGLPQNPRPPLQYKVVFNLEGVLGNYFGKAYVLRRGRVKRVPSFSDLERIDMGKPLGVLEAIITGGATSTCPWTFKGHLQNYDYKTVRYPGHYAKVQTLKELGLFETAPVCVRGHPVVPREAFVASVGSRLSFPHDKDLLVQRVTVSGWKDGRRVEVLYDVLDYQDARTGFTAMQRTTGFSAAVVASMLAQGLISARGAVPVERAVPARLFLAEIRRRGIEVKERMREAVHAENTFHQAA